MKPSQNKRSLKNRSDITMISLGSILFYLSFSYKKPELANEQALFILTDALNIGTSSNINVTKKIFLLLLGSLATNNYFYLALS